MKRTLALFAALAALLASLAAPAAAYTSITDSYRTAVLDCDDRFLVPYHFNSTAGGEVPDEQTFLYTRLMAFAASYDCDIYLGCVSSPEAMQFDSFDAYREDFLRRYSGALGDNAVCVLYDQESGVSQVHIGSAVAADRDTAPVTEALLDPEAEGNYQRMVQVLSALQSAIGRPETYLLYCTPEEHYEGVQRNMAPLRSKFTGPVFVSYINTGNGQEGRMEDAYTALYEMYRVADFYPDSIWILYCRNTGETDIWLGSGLDLRVEDLDAVKAAFTGTASPRDYSGFASGVQALADSLAAGEKLPAYVAPVILGTAAVVLALALAIEVLAHKRGKPLTLEGTAK